MGVWVGSSFFFLHCYDKIPWLKATYERICFDLLFGMGHPLWDQDSAVGSQYRNLVNHNILHRKQGEWGREGDRETETNREGGRNGETEVKQAYKLSKCLLHLPSPPPPPPHPPQWCTSSSKLQFLKAWWHLQAYHQVGTKCWACHWGTFLIQTSTMGKKTESRTNCAMELF